MSNTILNHEKQRRESYLDSGKAQGGVDGLNEVNEG